MKRNIYANKVKQNSETSSLHYCSPSDYEPTTEYIRNIGQEEKDVAMNSDTFLLHSCGTSVWIMDGKTEEADSQLSRSSMHSCSSMGYLVRSMSQATVDVMLGGEPQGHANCDVLSCLS